MYYALLIRYRRPFQILVLVIAFALIYALAAQLGFGKANPLVFSIALAYFLWALVMAGGVEKQIRRTMKQGTAPLGKEMILRVTSHSLSWEIPSKGARGQCQIVRLAAVFHITGLFMVYLDGRNTLLLPERDMQDEDVSFLDETFQARLGNRYYKRRQRG